MAAPALQSGAPCRPQTRPLGDPRFRALLPAAAWATLPEPVRRRFSHRVAAGESLVYQGVVLETRLSRCGWLLARLARLIGGPLPLENQAGTPSVVVVTEDAEGNGQFWTRQYGRTRDVPQVIHSSKRFTGPTGLEEQVGGGFGLALRLETEPGRLLFVLEHIVLRIFGICLRIPRRLLGLEMMVGHRHIDTDRFEFELSVCHRLLGPLVGQRAEYRDWR